VAAITGGEGWHNNHHHDPTSASVQHRWWEFDLNFYIIKGLEWLGLATDVVPQKHRRRRNRPGPLAAPSRREPG
jgi:stearoyl-CoA desaturase (delta-9 desaturase)